MKSLNRAMFIAVLVLVAMVSVACGGGSSGGGAGKPEDAAKNWVEALFKADGATLRNNMCDAQKAAITDDVVSSLASSLGGTGATLDTAGITYTVSGNNVTLGGNLKVTMSGQSVDVPMTSFPLGTLPVVQEGGGWKVCLSLNDLMGG